MRGDNHGFRSTGYQVGREEDVLYKSCVFLLLPIEKVLQIVHKRRLVQNALLRQGMQIVWVRKSLNEFQLKLEANAVRRLGLVNGNLRHFTRIYEVGVGTQGFLSCSLYAFALSLAYLVAAAISIGMLHPGPKKRNVTCLIYHRRFLHPP